MENFTLSEKVEDFHEVIEYSMDRHLSRLKLAVVPKETIKPRQSQLLTEKESSGVQQSQGWIHMVHESGSSSRNEDYFQGEQRSKNNIQQNNLCHKVSKLFEIGFHQGLSVNSNEIIMAISALNKNKDIFKNNVEYEMFLQLYGCIYGRGFNLYGQHTNVYEGCKVDRIIRFQNGFLTECKWMGINAERLEYLWLVGGHESKQYYIDASAEGNGSIYSASFHCGIERFAKNFLMFLDKILKVCEYEENGISSEDS